MINHKKVLATMNKLGLKAKIVKYRKYTSYKGQVGKIADNLLNRSFNAEFPNQKWATDITEFKVNDKKLYLSPIIDLYNREIMSFSIAESPSYSFVQEMLNKAIAKTKSTNDLLLHSDQGVYYQIERYQKILKSNNITQSM